MVTEWSFSECQVHTHTYIQWIPRYTVWYREYCVTETASECLDMTIKEIGQTDHKSIVSWFIDCLHYNITC